MIKVASGHRALPSFKDCPMIGIIQQIGRQPRGWRPISMSAWADENGQGFATVARIVPFTPAGKNPPLVVPAAAFM